MRVVLVGPRGGANVGAVCRAIKNMGAGDLAIVSGTFDWEEARRMAVHAGDVLRGARTVEKLSEAVSGCSLVVGTTCRRGQLRARADDIAAVAAELAAGRARLGGPIGLVFGSEDTGLENEEVLACHRLAYVPTSSTYPSLNLAQAVAISLYELRRAFLGGGRLPHPGGCEEALEPVADAAAVEAMLQALEAALVEIGFLRERGGEPVMAAIRSVLTRAGADRREVRIFHGIARQIRWFAEGGHEVIRRKRERGEKLR